jgi:hypothetical protein
MASLRFCASLRGDDVTSQSAFVAVGDKGVTKVSHGNRRPFGPKSGFLSLSGNSNSFSGLQPSSFNRLTVALTGQRRAHAAVIRHY